MVTLLLSRPLLSLSIYLSGRHWLGPQNRFYALRKTYLHAEATFPQGLSYQER